VGASGGDGIVGEGIVGTPVGAPAGAVPGLGIPGNPLVGGVKLLVGAAAGGIGTVGGAPGAFGIPDGLNPAGGWGKLGAPVPGAPPPNPGG